MNFTDTDGSGTEYSVDEGYKEKNAEKSPPFKRAIDQAGIGELEDKAFTGMNYMAGVTEGDDLFVPLLDDTEALGDSRALDLALTDDPEDLDPVIAAQQIAAGTATLEIAKDKMLFALSRVYLITPGDGEVDNTAELVEQILDGIPTGKRVLESKIGHLKKTLRIMKETKSFTSTMDATIIQRQVCDALISSLLPRKIVFPGEEDPLEKL